MEKLKHLDFFKRLLDEPKNELIEKSLKENRIPIGYSCFYVPEPVLSMGKAFPVKLRAPWITDTENATYYLSAMVCSYARSILEASLDGHYDFLQGNVGTTSCIHSTRAAEHFDILKTHESNQNFFNIILDVPKTKAKTHLEEAFAAQLKSKVAPPLADNYGIDVSDASLRDAIRLHNRYTAIMTKISDLRKAEHPKITGTEFHVLFTATKIVPKDMLFDKLEATLEELGSREGIKDYRARLMVTGSLMDNPEFTRLIEEQGALVVADRYCSGSLPGLQPIKEEGDPYLNIAAHYLSISQCPRMMGCADSRKEYALEQIKEFAVDGVLFETVKFCELWSYENLTFVPDMKEARVPIVGIEREYNPSSKGQLRTRIQAFIESIEIKKLNSQLRGR
ncbi:2-hydroxyacyl-CoA dehydratase subunit D [candidate division CSSED10-310 bacterium]|uniref:2-hydroxyacyl-CoA dehydratase subunit D n=1 Tax=candidate division CSSED10-310 bacterium TaxID=2855610 RepID=A0ABV6YUD0_UNCC1